jgi:hypothetical protein
MSRIDILRSMADAGSEFAKELLKRKAEREKPVKKK